MKTINQFFAGLCNCEDLCAGHPAIHLMNMREYANSVEDFNIIRVPTPRCNHCDEDGFVFVIRKDWITLMWDNPRPPIQEIFPYLSAEYREQIMTGFHPNCFRFIFSEEE